MYGAQLLKVEGEYGKTIYTMEVNDSVYKAIKEQPLVNYIHYMKKRNRYKDKARKAAGIILHARRSNSDKHHIQKMFH